MWLFINKHIFFTYGEKEGGCYLVAYLKLITNNGIPCSHLKLMQNKIEVKWT